MTDERSLGTILRDLLRGYSDGEKPILRECFRDAIAEYFASEEGQALLLRQQEEMERRIHLVVEQLLIQERSLR